LLFLPIEPRLESSAGSVRSRRHHLSQNGFRAWAVREGEVGQRGDHLGVDVGHRVPPRCARQLLISAVELVGAGRPGHARRVWRAAHRVRHLHVRRLGRVAQAEDAAASAGRRCRYVARPPPHVPPTIRGRCRAAVRGSRVRGHVDVDNKVRFGSVVCGGLCGWWRGSGSRVACCCCGGKGEALCGCGIEGRVPSSLFMCPISPRLSTNASTSNFVPNRTWASAERLPHGEWSNKATTMRCPIRFQTVRVVALWGMKGLSFPPFLRRTHDLRP